MKGKSRILILSGILLMSAASSFALPRSPFEIRVRLMPDSAAQAVGVEFVVPAECVLYSERLHFLTSEGDELTPSRIPDPVAEIDKVNGKVKKVYEHSFHVELPLASLPNEQLVVKFQGCSNANCFFPEKRTFILGTNASARVFSEILPLAPTPSASGLDWAAELHGFKIGGLQSGFLPAGKFLSFLDRAVSGQDESDDPLARFRNTGLAATLILILLGGILLNLTPCILPMIPINLAIIGAGSAANSRATGFKNGAVYGTGMALTYGLLGLGVVLTGAKFGTINSSVWFNSLIAVVFIVLGLGMFDLVNIDLSRFGAGLGPQRAHADMSSLIRNAIIFVMGVMAALLAGACVAPVVISVMLLATSIYARGHTAGLLLPFLLGTGMALPWPFAGAGLTFLPKPGKWMKRVKHGFGVMILVFSVYYAHMAVNAFQSRQDAMSLASAPPGAAAVKSDPNVDLAAALQQARESGQPVLVDFRASWCKNCLAMDETVFKEAQVKKRLGDFVLVRYDAERPGEAPAKEVLDHFNVMGLPAYLVLTSAK